MLHFPTMKVWVPATIMVQFKNFVPVVNFDLMGEIKPYTNFLITISQVPVDESSKTRRLEETHIAQTVNEGLSDQIKSLGYETYNPYLNLGSLVILLICYFGAVLVNFLIQWPIQKAGYGKSAYKLLNYALFFKGLFEMIFNTYYVFVFSTLLLCTSHY